jgi:predicted flap endonuclease-1-like 5' DNA nuclease
MNKRRPLGITILAVLVGLGALVAVYHTLQFLHILPFSLGPIRFFAFDLFGAFLWGVNAVILIWLVSSLWNLRLEGWLFVAVMAVLNLILAFLSVIGQSSFSAMLPAILINAIILIYCLTPNVKEAFGQVSRPAPAVATPGAAPAAVVQTPAPVMPAMQVQEKLAPIPEQAVAAAPPVVAANVPPAEEAPAQPEAAVVSAPPMESKAGEVAVPAPVARHKVPVETIEGIGPVYAAKLKETGILFVADLLEAGASRKGREGLVEKTGISATLMLKWVNMADLMRISGVGEEYSELLEAAGVDTVKELRNRNPENLYQAMLQANEQRKMVRRTPHLSEVQSWVEQAKQLEPVLTY